MDAVLAEDCHIAQSNVVGRIPEFESEVNHFEVLCKSGMMNAYCEKNELSPFDVEGALEAYLHIYDLLESHNESYVQNTMVSDNIYLDNILRDVDPQIMLDDDQRRVVLTDEDHCLVSAGADKTTTVAAKVKYPVEKNRYIPLKFLLYLHSAHSKVESS